jgi:restriction system protein
MNTVFLSYSKSDEQADSLAGKIRQHLSTLPSVHVDDLFESTAFDASLTEQLLDKIDRCKVFISIITHPNPNALFELGYALGRNKKALVIGDYSAVPYSAQDLVFSYRSNSYYELLSEVEKLLKGGTSQRSVSRFDDDPQSAIDTWSSKPALLDSLPAEAFERVIGLWLELLGFEVRRPDRSSVQAFDFIISPFREDRAVVEVKKYKQSSQISVPNVQQLLGLMAIAKASAGIIVSSTSFTKSAIEYARAANSGIILLSIRDLKRHRIMTREELEHIATSVSDT